MTRNDVGRMLDESLEVALLAIKCRGALRDALFQRARERVVLHEYGEPVQCTESAERDEAADRHGVDAVGGAERPCGADKSHARGDGEVGYGNRKAPLMKVRLFAVDIALAITRPGVGARGREADEHEANNPSGIGGVSRVLKIG